MFYIQVKPPNSLHALRTNAHTHLASPRTDVTEMKCNINVWGLAISSRSNWTNLCKQPSVMGCIVCCPAIYLAGLLPWRPAPDWPGSPCGLWMQRSAAVSYPGCPDIKQKLCVPPGLSHSHHGPTQPVQTPAMANEPNSNDNIAKTWIHNIRFLFLTQDKSIF